MTQCPSCSASNPPHARFCNQCGTALSAAPRPTPSYTPPHLPPQALAQSGEKKRVTVLFADVKGSTQLAVAAGAEGWHQILDGFFARLTAEVHRYGGTVNQYTGDGIMALFGAPIACEDHAQRAAHAALAMQREVRRYADGLRLSQGLNFSMRIGLNSGEVVVGRIGDDLRMDYTAQGLTTHLAARMEQVCEPGQITLTANTARALEGYFALRDLGAMPIHGAAEPIGVMVLEGLGRDSTRLARSLSRGAGGFVGREPEMQRLKAAWDKAQHRQQGGCVLLRGSAGLGKSRLCFEFAQQLQPLGVRVLRASAMSYSVALPLMPVQQLARSVWGLTEQQPAADARRLLAGSVTLESPAQAELLPALLDFLDLGDANAPAIDATVRQPLLQWLAATLLAKPSLIVVEDLHFCDAATLDFLHYLGHRLCQSGCLLLLNARLEFVGLADNPAIETLALKPLGETELTALATRALGEHASVQNLAGQLAARAGGNPFYLEEAIHALCEGGWLGGGYGSRQLLREIAQWPIPDTVHALLAARIDKQGPVRKTLLQAAAILEEPVPLPLLAEVVQQPLENVAEDASALYAAQIWTGEGEPQWSHALLREVAAGMALDISRRQWHRRAVAVLADGQTPPLAIARADAARIACHWEGAGEPKLAGVWQLESARWQAARDARLSLEAFRAARRLLDEAQGSALPPAAWVAARVTARSGIIRCAQFADVPPAEIDSCYQEGMALAEGHPAAEAEILVSYAGEHGHRGEALRAAELARASLERAVAHGAAEVVSRYRLAYLLAFNGVGWLHGGPAKVDAASQGRWLGDPIAADNVVSRGFYGLMLAERGELIAAKQAMDTALARAENEWVAMSWMQANLVEWAWLSGEYRQAMTAARRAVTQAERFGNPFIRAFALRGLGLAQLMANDADTALRTLTVAAPMFERGAHAAQLAVAYLAVRAEAHAALGHTEAATEDADTALALAQQGGADLWEVRAWCARLSLGDVGPTHPGFARALRLVEKTGALAYRGLLLERHARTQSGRARQAALADAAAAYQSVAADGHWQRLQSELAPARSGISATLPA